MNTIYLANTRKEYRKSSSSGYCLAEKQQHRNCMTIHNENSLQFSGPSAWNNLDEELISLSFRYFKQAMTKHFLSTSNA